MNDFDRLIRRDMPTCTDFFATWCGPCRTMHPIVDRLQEQMKGRIDVYKIDIDDPDTQEIVRRYNIRSVPTLMIFRRGEILWRSSGVMPFEQLVRTVEQLEKEKRTVGQG